ncbi:RNA pseudouridylate synthase domain-containing protein 3 [Alligator mississippiensis]|uniref:RNA pseudouridylate synthase domain-containing protein 3 n=1 Tax=Alligator mississippiensis TaxID=8496 RepID=A0A151NP32_ALLMI|nr:RNA pseudouridylate synthase domain-containing protein 3 [Alligator mississippiensis]
MRRSQDGGAQSGRPARALVALSKPVGLPVAGGAGAGAGGLTSRPAAGSPGQLSLEALLPQLSQRLALSPELHIVRAPGKESSGLVLLSTCHATTQRLQEFFVRARRTGRPPATYCAVTVGVPADSQGEIRTGLKLAQVGDARLVVPVAAPSQGSVARKEVKKTRTCYTVLGSAHGCSLLQLQPVTAFSSQLLVHLTLLLCPALGDHVYSPRVGAVLGQSFLLPAESTPPCTQVLPKQVLDRLRLTQQQVHLLPLHLHLHQLQLPAVVLAAPPPPFFLRTLHCLGLPTHLEPQGGCRQ